MIRTEPARARRKRPVSKVRLYWWLGPLALGVILLVWVMTGPEWSRPRTGKTALPDPLTGYVTNFATVAEEYRKFHGRTLAGDSVRTQFEQATGRMSREDYREAAQLLEEVAKTAAVPAVYNNLGLAYLAQDDRGHAINAFREALSRDVDYVPVRQNLNRLRTVGFDTATPLAREIEPNNTMALANIIAPGKSVEGEVMAASNDVDWYKVTAPAAPRDRIRIEMQSRSRLLNPMLKVYDAQHSLIEWLKGAASPGGKVSVELSPQPNETLYLEAAGFGDSAGPYTLTVTPLKAFDQYEPNDEIFVSRPIALGTAVDANIMDKADTDFYSFDAVKTGKVKVTVRNRSATLIPALTTFGPDMRASGFGPDVLVPGRDLEHTFDVTANQK
jgi:hypothetical protein